MYATYDVRLNIHEYYPDLLGGRTIEHQTIEHRTIEHQTIEHRTIEHPDDWTPGLLNTRTIEHPGRLNTRTIGHPGQLNTRTIEHLGLLNTRTIEHPDNWTPGKDVCSTKKRLS